MKKINGALASAFLLVTTVLYATPQSGKSKPVEAVRVSTHLVEALTGKPEKVLATSRTGDNSVIETESALFYFAPGETIPHLGFVSRIKAGSLANGKPISQKQVLAKARATAEILQFDLNSLSPQVCFSGRSFVPSTSANSIFVYYESNPEGIPTLGCGKSLELQYDAGTGQLLGFKCRRSVFIVGGKSLGIPELDRLLSSAIKSERVKSKGYLWRNVKQFESTRNLADNKSTKIIKTYYGATTTKVYFLRADNGKLLGIDPTK